MVLISSSMSFKALLLTMNSCNCIWNSVAFSLMIHFQLFANNLQNVLPMMSCFKPVSLTPHCLSSCCAPVMLECFFLEVMSFISFAAMSPTISLISFSNVSSQILKSRSLFKTQGTAGSTTSSFLENLGGSMLDLSYILLLSKMRLYY